MSKNRRKKHLIEIISTQSLKVVVLRSKMGKYNIQKWSVLSARAIHQQLALKNHLKAHEQELIIDRDV